MQAGPRPSDPLAPVAERQVRSSGPGRTVSPRASRALQSQPACRLGRTTPFQPSLLPSPVSPTCLCSHGLRPSSRCGLDVDCAQAAPYNHRTQILRLHRQNGDHDRQDVRPHPAFLPWCWRIKGRPKRADLLAASSPASSFPTRSSRRRVYVQVTTNSSSPAALTGLHLVLPVTLDAPHRPRHLARSSWRGRGGHPSCPPGRLPSHRSVGSATGARARRKRSRADAPL